jgi:hypothetical protein
MFAIFPIRLFPASIDYSYVYKIWFYELDRLKEDCIVMTGCIWQVHEFYGTVTSHIEIGNGIPMEAYDIKPS